MRIFILPKILIDRFSSQAEPFGSEGEECRNNILCHSTKNQKKETSLHGPERTFPCDSFSVCRALHKKGKWRGNTITEKIHL